jgi:hypothetical protein
MTLQQGTPALTLPQVRYGLSLLLLAVFCPLGVDDICRRVQHQLQRNELARCYHYRTHKCLPPRKLRREIQQVYTEQEYRDWIADTGFAQCERQILPNNTSLVRARKPR